MFSFSNKVVNFDQDKCECNDKLPLIENILQHVQIYFNESSFDNEKESKILFDKILRHIIYRNKKILNNLSKSNKVNTLTTSLPTKKELYELYTSSGIKNEIFELLIRQDSNKSNNGENCIPVPSVELDSCPHFCRFCPTAKGVAKSYTLGQSVFSHFLENEEDLPRFLFQHLLRQHLNGNSIEKIACRHLGGTFSSYSELYRLKYACEMYYSSNVVFSIIQNEELLHLAKDMKNKKFDPENIILSKLRPIHLSNEIAQIEEQIRLAKLWKNEKWILQEEEKLIDVLKQTLLYEQNENTYNSLCKVVSFSIETRPDSISKRSLQEFRLLGVTIVELGLQSPNNEILNYNKRGHTVETSKRAIVMIREAGFHVHGQWMMDLPGSDWEKEEQSVRDILNIDLECDQIKIYPHLAMPNTVNYDLYISGEYKSLAEEDFDRFLEILSQLLQGLGPTTRVNRIQRDLPKKSKMHPDGYANNQPSNLEQLVTDLMKKKGTVRRDIRSCEPKLRKVKLNEVKYGVIPREFKNGTEYFIAAYTSVKDKWILWGYCRVFLKNESDLARVRELKVNGNITGVSKKGNAVQHLGIGSHLLHIAEDLALFYKYKNITVTSAVGVRGYYEKKHNYILNRDYLMEKELINYHNYLIYIYWLLGTSKLYLQ
jgi:ELP3 family radical SAM enzyme/protein acetyltransferase